MPLVLRKFNRGDKHPPFSCGSYTADMTDEQGKKAAEGAWGTLEILRQLFPTQKAWNDRYQSVHGHILSSTAWIFLWEDEENEFGPVTP